MTKLVFFRATPRGGISRTDAPSRRERPLVCVWARDPASGRLVCRWRRAGAEQAQPDGSSPILDQGRPPSALLAAA
jgi:hypothetical protein